MPRIRRPSERAPSTLPSRLIVIAAEGYRCEPRYFEGLKRTLRATWINLDVLKRSRREAGNSSPRAVVDQLISALPEYDATPDGDLFFAVVDRDAGSSTESGLDREFERCRAHGIALLVSNPCFELWLLLHVEDVAALPDSERQRIALNAGSGNQTELKVRLRRLLGGYNPAHLAFEKFAPHLTEAVERAKNLDPDPTRWPRTLGTQVYRIIEPLLEGMVD